MDCLRHIPSQRRCWPLIGPADGDDRRGYEASGEVQDLPHHRLVEGACPAGSESEIEGGKEETGRRRGRILDRVELAPVAVPPPGPSRVGADDDDDGGRSDVLLAEGSGGEGLLQLGAEEDIVLPRPQVSGGRGGLRRLEEEGYQLPADGAVGVPSHGPSARQGVFEVHRPSIASAVY